MIIALVKGDMQTALYYASLYGIETGGALKVPHLAEPQTQLFLDDAFEEDVDYWRNHSSKEAEGGVLFVSRRDHETSQAMIEKAMHDV